MEIWGLHSRSLPYTAWQLLFRPGYLIRDYVTGKRQVSFPPVKMLVLLGVIVYLLGHWWLPNSFSHEMPQITATGALYYVNYAWKWLMVRDEWLMLVLFSTFIIPTWIVFRQAPMLKRHTLPQGFFIQVFIANQSLVIELIGLLVSLLLFFVPYSSIRVVILLFLVVYLYIDYKQLFGYNWWGTLWRMVTMLVLIFMIALLLGIGIAVFNESGGRGNVRVIVGIVIALIVNVYLTALMIYSINVVNRKTWRERGIWQAWKVPIIAVAVLTLIFLVMYALTLL